MTCEVVTRHWFLGYNVGAGREPSPTRAEKKSWTKAELQDFQVGLAQWMANHGADAVAAERKTDPDPREMWRTTRYGRKFYFYRPEEHDFYIGDIAHHLAQLNRWGGACVFPLSVAQHSTVMATSIYAKTMRPELALDALFHDAEEAYWGDIVKPMKVGLSAETKRLMKRTDTAIRLHFRALGVPARESAEVKEFDSRITHDEREQCLAVVRSPGDAAWFDHPAGPLGEVFQPTDWLTAKHQWLQAVEVYSTIYHRRQGNGQAFGTSTRN